MKKHKFPRCSCYKGTRDMRCQFHNKLSSLRKLDPKSKEVEETIEQMEAFESSRIFRRDPFTVEEILAQRAAKSKGPPSKPLTHNPFSKLRNT